MQSDGSPYCKAILCPLAYQHPKSFDTNGVVITNVEDDSAAANFGFQKKDVIQVINGQKVDDTKALDALVQEPRRLWRITILRDGQQISTILGG